MTRDEAIELLKLMRRQQQEEDSVAPLDPEMLARAYVQIYADRRKGPDRRGSGGGNGAPAC